MMCHRFVCARSIFAATLKTTVALGALAFVLTGTAGAVDFSVGNKEVIYTKAQRTNKKLSSWPDGSLGVVRNAQGGYDFYGANGGSPAKTTGSLWNPGTSKKSVSITNWTQNFDYISGGPIYQDPATGMRLMVYHAETHGKSAKDFYSMLGVAASTDPNGLSFRDLGVIVQPNLSAGRAEVGGGTFAVMGDYFNIYYKDVTPQGVTSELSVARAPISQLVSNALSGRGTSFTKYYDGGWTQPGLGGLASPLEVGNPSNSWASVSYNDYLNQLVLVSSQWTPSKEDLYLSTSADGINWSPRQALVTDAGEQFYPTLIGTGADPTHTDKSFYVYYTDSKKGAWNRWKDAQLVRREITLGAYSGAVTPTPYDSRAPLDPPAPAPPQPSPVDWASLAAFKADYQTGAPAAGWKYMWNANGTRGNSATFVPLKWSSYAQVYNTTGGFTTVPGSKNHSDDYLSLSYGGGSPGRGDFTPVVGYTIQEDDGAGFYRLAGTSIQKWDTTISPQEDGLDLLVYINDTMARAAANVSVDGSLLTFDHDLGQLNVGDTIWVMVDSLNNNYYDGFTNFDFSIQKAFPIATSSMMAMLSLVSVGEVPEPGTVGMLVAALAGGYLLRRPRRKA